MTWLEPSVGSQHDPPADVVFGADVHLVADVDLRTVVVGDAPSGQQAVRSVVRGGGAVGHRGAAGARTPAVEAAVFKGGGDAGVVLLAGVGRRGRELADDDVADVEGVSRAAGLDVEDQTGRRSGQIAEAEGALDLGPGGAGKRARRSRGCHRLRKWRSQLSWSRESRWDWCCRERRAVRRR